MGANNGSMPAKAIRTDGDLERVRKSQGDEAVDQLSAIAEQFAKLQTLGGAGAINTHVPQ